MSDVPWNPTQVTEANLDQCLRQILDEPVGRRRYLVMALLRDHEWQVGENPRLAAVNVVQAALELAQEW